MKLLNIYRNLSRYICQTRCILLLLLGLLLFANCSEDDTIPELRFSIAVTEVCDFSAKVTVTHTGTNRVKYCAFVVEGKISDIDTEIQKYQNTVSDESMMAELFNQKKRVITLPGLMPQTTYTCIVYGLDEGNKIIGTPSSTFFETTPSAIEFSTNQKWSLKYLGQSKYDKKTFSKINIYVEGDVEERYFVMVYDKKIIDQYSNIQAILLKAFNDFNSQYNDLDSEFFWVEDKFVRTGNTSYYKYLTKGQYQAFVVGVDANGALTGHYAYSDVFDFDHYELEPEYAELLGEWKITDEMGEEIFFSLSEKWANSTLVMSGFGFNYCPLTLKYTPEENYLLTLSSQSAIGVSWGDDESKTMTLRAWYLNEDDSFRIHTSSTINTLARSKGKNLDGTYTFTRGFNITLNNEEYAKTLGILLTYYNEEKKLMYFNSSKIQLPFTMKKLD